MVGQRWRLALGQVTYRTDLSLYMLGCCHQGLHWQAHLRQGFLKVSQLLWGFPDSSVGKESACNAGDPSLIPGSGRSPGEGIGHPLQCSGLENSMDCLVRGVAKSQTRLSDFHFHENRKEAKPPACYHCISQRQGGVT